MDSEWAGNIGKRGGRDVLKPPLCFASTLGFVGPRVTKADAKTGEDPVELLGSVASVVMDIEFLWDTAP